QSLLERDPAFAEQAARFRYLRQRLSNLPLNRPQGMTHAEFQQEMAKLREESEQLEGKLNRALAQRKPRDGEEASADAVQRRLAAGGALVEFVRVSVLDFKAAGTWGPYHYFAFVLAAGDGSPEMIDLGEAA